MNIGIDIDDTTTYSYDNFLIYALEYDKTLRGTGIIEKNMKYDDDFDWTDEETQAFYRKYFIQAFGNVKPKMDAIPILQQLYQDGHHLIFITSRNDKHSSIADIMTKQWMDTYQIPYTKIITKVLYKGPICEQEQIDLFIDDSWGQCTFVADHYPISVLLYDEYHRFNSYPGLTIVNNWKEIYTYVQHINTGSIIEQK